MNTDALQIVIWSYEYCYSCTHLQLCLNSEGDLEASNSIYSSLLFIHIFLKKSQRLLLDFFVCVYIMCNMFRRCHKRRCFHLTRCARIFFSSSGIILCTMAVWCIPSAMWKWRSRDTKQTVFISFLNMAEEAKKFNSYIYFIITALFHFNTKLAFLHPNRHINTGLQERHTIKDTVNVTIALVYASSIFTKQDNLKLKDNTISTKKGVTAINLCNSSHFSLTFPPLQYFFTEEYFENMKLELLWLHQLEDKQFDSWLLKILDPQCVWMVSFLCSAGWYPASQPLPSVYEWGVSG